MASSGCPVAPMAAAAELKLVPDFQFPSMILQPQ